MTTQAASVLAQPKPDTSLLPWRTAGQPQHPARQLRCGAPAMKDTQLLRDDRPATDLMAGARGGDKRAWDALVEYAPLIWSICRKYRLGPADSGDVGQTVTPRARARATPPQRPLGRSSEYQ